MILVEKHIINYSHKLYKECDKLSFLSKNLYNLGLYTVRQFYFENKKYLPYVQNFHQLKSSDAYKSLPAKISNQTLKLVDQNFKSFFGLLKTEGSLARIPKYLDKTEGRYLVKYEKQALGFRHFKKTGRLLLSKTNIDIKTNVKDWNLIKEVRIVPRNNQYVIEVVYEKQEKTITTNNMIASIDPGLNNLATITFNKTSLKPIILNGKPLKSINQYYNKKYSFLQSELQLKQKKHISKNIYKLTNKRNNKINDYLHKASRILVNRLVSRNVDTLIIGKNKGQKQDINMGSINNQSFVTVPIARFLDMVAYKSRLEGINVIWQEESYTSKASFLNLDYMPIYGKDSESEVQGEATHYFSGYRKHSGLYKIKGEKRQINADVNGSYNIMRKAVPEALMEGIEGLAVNPFKLYV
jgi:putative transposase